MDERPPRYAPITPLPPMEVEKICAGEVVERPLNVVKELVENALDAGASRITVELEGGGRELVRVSDDGHGIPAAELPRALQRHATSKIRAMDDIYALSTLGFRGEALASVAAVARLSLTSRVVEAELGARITAAGGAIAEVEALSYQPGTEVEVRDLFYNTPARRKFLKGQQAETAQISALISAYALAHPELHWQLKSQGRTLLQTDGEGGRAGVLADLAGLNDASALTEVDFEFPPSAVRGYISQPHIHRHNRRKQWYFVNGRPVANPALYKAVDDAVREFLSPGKFPVGAFFLELPPEEIDVNVHPMKTEVRFADNQGAYRLLLTAVKRALGAAASERQRELTHGLAAIVEPRIPRSSHKQHPSPGDDPDADPDTSRGKRAIPLYTEGRPLPPDPQPAIEFPGRKREDLHPLSTASQTQHVSIKASSGHPESHFQHAARPATESLFTGSELEEGTISQVADGYLVVTTPDEMYLIDQHAAHERILFEELYAGFITTGETPHRQRLLFPLLVPLDAAEIEFAAEQLKALASLGFNASKAPGNGLIVEEVPLLLAPYITPELLAEVVHELAGQGTAGVLDEQVKALAASLACRAAIKAGDALSLDDQVRLVRLLLSQASSLACPHGRPTVIRMGASELARLFQR